MREQVEKILNAYKEFSLRLETVLSENPADQAFKDGGSFQNPREAPPPREARTRLGEKPRWEIG